MNVRGMSGCQVNFKSQSELDIGGHETCSILAKLLLSFQYYIVCIFANMNIVRDIF